MGRGLMLRYGLAVFTARARRPGPASGSAGWPGPPRRWPRPSASAVIGAWLPSHEWPARRLVIAAVDADTGECATFDSASGVSLIEAVSASCAVPGVWPPVQINGRRWMDGGMRSAANADLARRFRPGRGAGAAVAGHACHAARAAPVPAARRGRQRGGAGHAERRVAGRHGQRARLGPARPGRAWPGTRRPRRPCPTWPPSGPASDVPPRPTPPRRPKRLTPLLARGRLTLLLARGRPPEPPMVWGPVPSSRRLAPWWRWSRGRRRCGPGRRS